jgi:hypothetical protein
MKRFKILVAFALIITLFFIIPFSYSTTTIGNSSFPAEENDSYIWKCVNSTGEDHNNGDLTKFTVDYIYNDTLSYGWRNMIVNYSIDQYDVIKGQWVRYQDNVFYMAYNYSLNFINWSEITYQKANLYLVPIPVNFTLIGDAIEREGYLNYSIDGKKLILDHHGNGTIVEVTINDNGISQIIEEITNDSTVYRWELYSWSDFNPHL